MHEERRKIIAQSRKSGIESASELNISKGHLFQLAKGRYAMLSRFFNTV